MKIKFQAPKGRRIKNNFLWVCLDSDTVDNGYSYMYFSDSKEWRKDSELKEGETCASNACNCRSLKSAVRLIKKWNFPKGTTFILCSRFFGHDVYITV